MTVTELPADVDGYGGAVDVVAARPWPVATDRFAQVRRAIAAVAAGGLVVVVDDADREDEGDLIAAAELTTPETVNFMATHGRGLICCAVGGDQLQRLRIPAMATHNADPHGTAFHVGVDHALARTGISAGERAMVIRALADPTSTSADVRMPGHVFPLQAHPDGVRGRRGHTEAAVELARLAGLRPAGTLCEIAGPDGEMARRPALTELARRHGLPLITIDDLVEYRRVTGPVIERHAQAELPTRHGLFTAIAYREPDSGREHLALVHGDPTGRSDVLTRVHSECLTGDVFGSLRCDCGDQLDAALATTSAAPCGVVVYLRGHEGRGIGLVEKIRAYALQDLAGLDTVDANLELGHPADAREYGVAASVLRDLLVTGVRLITNNPDKCAALTAAGIDVVERVPALVPATEHNAAYLATKASRMGHRLS